MAAHKSKQAQATLPTAPETLLAHPAHLHPIYLMSSLAAGACWQLLIALVEALVGVGVWKLKALCQSFVMD